MNPNPRSATSFLIVPCGISAIPDNTHTKKHPRPSRDRLAYRRSHGQTGPYSSSFLRVENTRGENFHSIEFRGRGRRDFGPDQRKPQTPAPPATNRASNFRTTEFGRISTGCVGRRLGQNGRNRFMPSGLHEQASTSRSIRNGTPCPELNDLA
jgi:hypothetical protein